MVQRKWLTGVGVLALAMATVVGSAWAGAQGAAVEPGALAAKDGGVFQLAAKDGGVLELASKDSGVLELASKDGGALELLAKEAGVVELATDK